MHTIRSAIFLLVFSLSCSSSTDPDSSGVAFDFTEIVPATGVNIPDSSNKLYFEDASRLALREIFSVGSADTGKVNIPGELVNTIYNGFLHIYSSESAARDSVFNIFSIHTLRYPVMHSLMVSVDTNKVWVKSWKKGNRLTGNSKIDDIMDKYDLELDNFFQWSFADVALIASESPVNLIALAALFEPVIGVKWSEPNGIAGDSNDIFASDEGSHWEFTFSHGWGDCPSGCIGRHFWYFNVFPDGTVEYTGSGGSRLSLN